MTSDLSIAVFDMGFMYSGGGERTAIYENILLKKEGITSHASQNEDLMLSEV